MSVDATDPKVPIVRVKAGKRAEASENARRHQGRKDLQDLAAVTIGRLSVVPLTQEQWEWFLK